MLPLQMLCLLLTTLATAAPLTEESTDPIVPGTSGTAAQHFKLEDRSPVLIEASGANMYGAHLGAHMNGAPLSQSLDRWDLNVTTEDGLYEFDLSYYNRAACDQKVVFPQYKAANGSVADTSLADILHDVDVACAVPASASCTRVADQIIEQLYAFNNETYDLLTDVKNSPLPNDAQSMTLRREVLTSPDWLTGSDVIVTERGLSKRVNKRAAFLLTVIAVSIGAPLSYSFYVVFSHIIDRSSYSTTAFAIALATVLFWFTAAMAAFALSMRDHFVPPLVARMQIFCQALREMILYLRLLAIDAGTSFGQVTRDAIVGAYNRIRSGNWRGVNPPTPPEFRTQQELEMQIVAPHPPERPAGSGPNAC